MLFCFETILTIMGGLNSHENLESACPCLKSNVYYGFVLFLVSYWSIWQELKSLCSVFISNMVYTFVFIVILSFISLSLVFSSWVLDMYVGCPTVCFIFLLQIIFLKFSFWLLLVYMNDVFLCWFSTLQPCLIHFFW